MASWLGGDVGDGEVVEEGKKRAGTSGGRRVGTVVAHWHWRLAERAGSRTRACACVLDGASRSRCAQRRIAGAYVLARAARKHQWLAGNGIRTTNCDIFYQAVFDLDVGTAIVTT